MISIAEIRERENKIIVLGLHEPIIQSILDFDYLSGKKVGSIAGIITGRSGVAKLFFGRNEILIPTYLDLHGITGKLEHWDSNTNFWFLNLLSGRRTLSSTLDTQKEAFIGGALFAENVPELHSLQIISAIHRNTGTPENGNTEKLIVGPASVGLLVPGHMKLGPIGGITPTQIIEGQITSPGHVAVFSASGGMCNELMSIATQAGHQLSFSLSFGGDRFPVLSPSDACKLAEEDPETRALLYYGELGGEDEYEMIKLKEEGKLTKPVIAHVAGTVASLFPESPQFGHAKAKADKERSTARAKRAALKSAGFQVSDSFSEFIKLVTGLVY